MPQHREPPASPAAPSSERRSNRIPSEAGNDIFTGEDGDLTDFYRTFLDSISDMAYLKDESFRHIIANAPLLRFFGKRESEVIGRTDFELMPEGAARKCRMSDTEALETDTIHTDEEPVGDRIYETRKFRVRIGKDKYGIGGYIRDVTDKRQVASALKASEEKFRAIAETTPSAIFIIQDTKVRYVNPAFERITGYNLAELKWIDYWELAHGDYRELIKVRGLARQRGEAVPSRYELKIVTKNGEQRWIDLAATNLEYEGRPAILGTAIDITDRVLAEEAIRKSEAQYRLLINNANEAIVVAQSGVIKFANPKTMEMTEYSAEELLSRPFTDCIHPEDREMVSERFQARVAGGSAYPEIYPFRCVTKTGKIIWVEINAVSFTWNGRGATLNFLTDITARREAEDLIGQTIARMEKSIEAIIQVISATVEARDPYTAGHQKRVAELARAIALEMGLSPEQADGIRVAGAIHDLGKLSIPAEILSKPTRLTDIEYDLIKFHAQIGHDILQDIDFPWPIARMIMEHHERMDGSGYPRHLKGQDLLLASRIISVADVVESMASHRPYRPSLGIHKAIEEISSQQGVRYDADVVAACLRLLKDKNFKFR